MSRRVILSLSTTATVFLAVLVCPLSAAEPAPHIATVSKPAAGSMQMIFHGGTGPFQVQKRNAIAIGSPWTDISEARITEVNTGVFLATFPMGAEDTAFYRVLSVGENLTELNGWILQVNVTTPSNGTYFVAGEAPVVTVRLLDTFGQGMSRTDFSRLNLYMYGPQDPRKTVTASKLLNASTNRASTPHHYIDLKSNPNVQVSNNVMTYNLQPVTDEAPGTYVVTVWAVLAADGLQQIMPSADIQIGSSSVESELVTKAKCAECHQGPISGKTYLHHIDPSAPGSAGYWVLDDQPVRSCKACHNNEGYAAYTDRSIPGVTNRVPDAIVLRAHGVHFGEELKLPANTNSINGNFREYTHVIFPADVRNCTKCHVDDRWKTQPTRMACGSCHDTTWFGPETAVPPSMHAHAGGPRSTDNSCSACHPADGEILESVFPVSAVHHVPPPRMNPVGITMSPPANGSYYVAGEKPVVTMVIYDDATNSIDHTKVTDANFSTASLFVYGPRSRPVPVLTSTASNVNSKLRASVSSSKAGPWAINGAIFKIAINGSIPQEITISGASNLVTAAEVVASLNPVITNLNGGARATVSGANVNIRTLIQGASARIEIYDGTVTTAMGWKRGPNTIMEPDVTIAAGSTAGNDLRALADPLDYQDPKVSRTTGNITYALDDVTGLVPGTYHIYMYHLPRAGRIAGLAAPTGVGYTNFQVGTSTREKKIAASCTDCHGDTIWHLTAGPIHAEPFDTDYCVACHDYGHTAPGDMFKNQGGTSLSGWSGFGAMPLSRRVHGVHYAHYLEHSEEIYANATKETFGGIIFPQDVRNCTKCHSETSTWKQEPSRMACLGCHDTDAAKAHGKLMTFFGDPDDPYGPAAMETCTVCHGEGAEFSADKVHRISKPYVPPYPRSPTP